MNVFRRTNSVVTDEELVADVNRFDRDLMISPLGVFIRAGRLALFVDDGKLQVGLYHLTKQETVENEIFYFVLSRKSS